MPVIARYAAITLPPLFLLLLGGLVWGGFAWIALLWLTLAAAIGDQVLSPPGQVPEDHMSWLERLTIILAIGHFTLMVVTLGALTSGDLTFGQGIALLLGAASFIGQVSHPNAHELIHRDSRILRALGAAVYTSIGLGHHVSAHRLVHHAHVGTEVDPSTPLPSESFFAYVPRAWRGSFEAGLEAEMDILERRELGDAHITNPYWIWGFGAVFAFIASIIVAGPFGAVFFVLLAGLGCLQILMSDYIQHYGLQRLELPNGRIEPVGPHHSWNAPRGFSSYLMLNAPAHSEHHMHPNRPYGALDSGAAGPVLPYSMPIMAVLALMPDTWRRIMDKRAVKVMEAALAERLNPTPPPQPTELPEPTPEPAMNQTTTEEDKPLQTASDTAPPPRTYVHRPTEPIAEQTTEPTIADDPETQALLEKIRNATQ